LNTPKEPPAGVRTAPLPLVIGITGHRDLRPEDVAALEERVREIFVEVQQHYPHTPLILLSPLAEGADRLAARVALEFGAALVVPLPMRKDLYLQDMSGTASVEEFETLLRQAQVSFELPLARGNTLEEIREEGEERNRQYAQVGAYIADHCQILIALWDGVDTEAEGGTADIVRFKLEGLPETYAPPHGVSSPLDVPESGPVYHIVTPRRSTPNPRGKPLQLVRLFPRDQREGDAESAFARIYERMEIFNRDARSLASRLAETLAASKKYLLSSLDRDSLPASVRSILECYAVADTLAEHFQRRMVTTLYLLMGLVFLMAFFYNLYCFDVWKAPFALALYPVLGVIAYIVLYGIAGRGEYQNKHQDYRALAEGLRVQFFWRLAGLPDSVADHYLRKQKGELDWIRNAIQVWRIGADHEYLATASTGGVSRAQRIEEVLECWVEDQRAWHKKVARRAQHVVTIMERWVNALAGLSLGMAAVLAVLHPSPGKQAGWFIAVSMLLVGAALLHTYTDKIAIAEHAKSYERMGLLFANAKDRLVEALEAGEHAKVQRLLRELGQEALEENGDWVLLHRQRPLEVPSG
jgi:hypothetical protein